MILDFTRYALTENRHVTYNNNVRGHSSDLESGIRNRPKIILLSNIFKFVMLKANYFLVLTAVTRPIAFSYHFVEVGLITDQFVTWNLKTPKE